MPLLHVAGVRFAYGARVALDGVTLRVEAGEVVAVVGPNGAGKSTLLRVAGGLLAPSAGRVLLDGRDLAAMPGRERARRVGGVAAQEDAAFPFTVRETVALGRHPWRGRFAPLGPEDARRVEAAMEATGLADLGDRVVPSLSTGERQRASLARCLAQDPQVLLLDEPTAHLDLGHRARVWEAVRAAARDGGKAVLAALHDLSLAALAADRVVLLQGGSVRAEGAPGDVLTPARVAEAFGAGVDVIPHPRTGLPVVVAAVPGGTAP